MERTLGSPLSSDLSEHYVSLQDNKVLVNRIIGGLALAAIGLWLLIFGLSVSGNVPGPVLLPLSIAFASALIVLGFAFLLNRQGNTIYAGRVLHYGTVLWVAVVAFYIGGSQGPIILMLAVPVVAAGLLSKSRASLGVLLVAILAYLLIFALERNGASQPIAVPLGWDAPIRLLTLIAIGTLAYASGRDLSYLVAQSQGRAEELMLRTEQLIEKSIQQVELGSELAAAAAQMQVTSQQQASGATEQASAVSEVGTTIEELGSTARQIAQAAEHVASAAQQTLENLSEGQGAVDESIQAMERIRARMQDISSRVLSLGERSQQIGEIIDLIDDISDETHLLALNAAIEAAGAGEHGRRFAVVAAEVKSLANRTLAAAKEVKGVIAEIRQATGAAVLAAEEGSKEVERGVDLAHRAGQVMDNIVMVAERTAQSAAEIGLATAQQQSASEQVVETMREIAEVSRQSASGARQIADSAGMLSAVADRLHGVAQP
jgi:methyl-accepting chemotaxis protein